MNFLPLCSKLGTKFKQIREHPLMLFSKSVSLHVTSSPITSFSLSPLGHLARTQRYIRLSIKWPCNRNKTISATVQLYCPRSFWDVINVVIISQHPPFYEGPTTSLSHCVLAYWLLWRQYMFNTVHGRARVRATWGHIASLFAEQRISPHP